MGQIKGMISSMRLILFYTIQQIIPNICTKCENHRCSSSWEIFNTNSLCITLEWQMEKWKNATKKDKFNLSILISSPQYTWCHSQGVYKILKLALIGVEKSVIENLIGDEEKWTNKGNDKRRKLILSYTIQQVIPNICIKFQNPRQSSSWETLDTNFPMYYIGVRNGKKKEK